MLIKREDKVEWLLIMCCYVNDLIMKEEDKTETKSF